MWCEPENCPTGRRSQATVLSRNSYNREIIEIMVTTAALTFIFPSNFFRAVRHN